METVYQLLSNKKYRMLLYVTLLVSFVITFVVSTYFIMANANTVDDRYYKERILNERLREGWH